MAEHDDARCAASNVADPDRRPDGDRCLDGEVYGWCGHENCYGICEWQGTCTCRCHGPNLLSGARGYAALVNAPLACTTAREIGRRMAGGDYPRYKVALTKSVVAEQVIFVDGPVAGTIRPIANEWISYAVSVPKPLHFGFATPDLAPVDDTAYYSITGPYYYDYAARAVRIAFRVASVDGSRVDDAALAEHGLTGLAEQGLISWDDIPDTAIDRDSPLEILEVGDPLKDCQVEISDPFHPPTEMIGGFCGCGWRTDWQIPMARRAQVVRAAHKHAAGQQQRRERYALPVRVLEDGNGLTDTCLASYDFDEGSGLVAARCRVCGWRTEQVERYRGKPLNALRETHIGPGGVRNARNRMLTALGLPSPTEEEEEEKHRA